MNLLQKIVYNLGFKDKDIIIIGRDDLHHDSKNIPIESISFRSIDTFKIKKSKFDRASLIVFRDQNMFKVLRDRFDILSETI
jgi:hypothetical protein